MSSTSTSNVAPRKTKNKLLDYRKSMQLEHDLSAHCIDLDVEFSIPVETTLHKSSENGITTYKGECVKSLQEIIHDSENFYERVSSLIKYHYDQNLENAVINATDADKFPKNFLLQELAITDLQIVREKKQCQGLFKMGATLALPCIKHISNPLDDFVSKDGVTYRKLYDEDRDRSYLPPHRHEIVHNFSASSVHQMEYLITPHSSLEVPLIFPSDCTKEDFEEPPLRRRGHTTHYFDPTSGRFVGDSKTLALESSHFLNDTINPSSNPRYKSLKSTSKDGITRNTPSVLLGYDSYSYPYFSEINDTYHVDDSDDEVADESGRKLKTPKFAVDLGNYVKFANGLRYKIAEARCGDLSKWQLACSFQDFWYANRVRTVIGRMRLRILPLVPKTENTHLIPYHNQLTHLAHMLKTEAIISPSN